MKVAPNNSAPEKTPSSGGGARITVVTIIILIIFGGLGYLWQKTFNQEKAYEVGRLNDRISNLNMQVGQLQQQNNDLNTQVTKIKEDEERQKKVKDVTTAVGDLFVTKYNEDISEFTVAIEKDAPEHVYGLFKLSNDPDVDGGYFFATVVEGKWKVVLSGKGEIPCELLTNYNFPEEMKDQCVSVGDDWESYQ